MKKRFLSIVLWSMIAAAFIGPGTLTTASAAGAQYSHALVWTLVFATFACYLLQEASARISIVSGNDLPGLMRARYRKVWAYFIGASVVFGCAAYQAGNILGAVSGLQLISALPTWPLVLIIALAAGTLLYLGNFRLLSTVLSVLVGFMGISFILIALVSGQDWAGVASGIVPSLPLGSEWLVLGLVGTTIVPYNLFLGSGLSKGQDVPNMRYGLFISVVLGGIISIAILLTGSLIQGGFSFQSLSDSMRIQLGDWAVYLLGGGLFAAGFTSSITAPFAAGLIFRGFIGGSSSGKWYHVGWAVVLLTGFVVGIMDLRPIPVIITAQALNGFILPAICALLMIMANDSRIVAKQGNGLIRNLWFILVLTVTSAIGANNLVLALKSLVDLSAYRSWILPALSLLAVLITLHLVYKVREHAR